MIRPGAWQAPAIVAVLALAVPAHVRAGEAPRLERVLLLPVDGRVSVVFEMTGAPSSVTSRRISADLVELDAGPVQLDRSRALAAPSGASLVSNVIVDRTGAREAGGSMRARITVREACDSTVRVQGNRVYLDLSPAASSAQARVVQTMPAAARSASPAKTGSANAAVIDDDADEREALRASLDRLGEMLPFLTSAASAPSSQVLAALATPMAALERTVRALPGAPALRPAEGLLTSAIAAASKIVDPAYRGDRVEQVRQAAIFFDEAKRESADATK